MEVEFSPTPYTVYCHDAAWPICVCVRTNRKQKKYIQHNTRLQRSAVLLLLTVLLLGSSNIYSELVGRDRNFESQIPKAQITMPSVISIPVPSLTSLPVSPTKRRDIVKIKTHEKGNFLPALPPPLEDLFSFNNLSQIYFSFCIRLKLGQ